MTTHPRPNPHADTNRARGLFRPGSLHIRLRFSWLLLLISILPLGEGLRAQAAGIVIFKDNTAVPDSSAKVMEYTTARRAGEITQYFKASGESIKLTKFHPQITVDYPNLVSRPITGPEQLGFVQQVAANYRETTKKYPNAAPYLNRYIQGAEEIQRRIKGGDVLFNGAFMTKAEYGDLIKREEQISEEFMQKGRDRKRLEEEEAMRADIENRRRKQ